MEANNKSVENYLETILTLNKTRGSVRSIDIVNDTGYKKSSISVAMKKLRSLGYIEMDNDGYIALTETGLATAEAVYQKHRYLKDFFMALGVSEKTAISDACKIEHEISEETFYCIKEYFEDKNGHIRD